MKNNPWDEIDKLMKENTVSEKDGWFTIEQFTEKYGTTRNSARTFLDNWHVSGVLEKCYSNIKDGNRKIKYYRYNQSKNL